MVLGLCLTLPGYAQSENEKPGDQAGAQRQQGQRQQGQRQQGGQSGPNDAPIVVKVAGALGAALRRNNGKIDLAVKDLEEKLKQNPEGISDPAGKAALVKALSDIKKAGPAGGKRVVDGILAEADKARASARQQGGRQQGREGARGRQGGRQQGGSGAEHDDHIFEIAEAVGAALNKSEGKTDRVANVLESEASQEKNPSHKAALLKVVSDLRKAGPAGSKRVLDGIFAAANKASEHERQQARGQQSGRQQSGRQQSGRQQSGRQQSGRQQARGQQSGRQQARGQQSGRQQGRSGEQSGPRTPPRVFVALRGVFGDEPDRDKGLAPEAILKGLMRLDENKDGKLSPNELLQPSKPE